MKKQSDLFHKSLTFLSFLTMGAFALNSKSWHLYPYLLNQLWWDVRANCNVRLTCCYWQLTFTFKISVDNDYDCNEKAKKRETEMIPLLACSKPFHRFQSLRVKRRSWPNIYLPLRETYIHRTFPFPFHRTKIDITFIKHSKQYFVWLDQLSPSFDRIQIWNRIYIRVLMLMK